MTEVRVRTFVKDSMILAVSNAGARLVNFLLLPVYTSVLAPSVYGITDLTINIAYLFVIPMSMQMQWGLQAFFHDGEGDAYQSQLVSTCFAFFAGAASLAFLPLLVLRPIASAVLGDSSYGSVLALGVVFAVALLLYIPLETATRMRGRTSRLAAYNLVKVALVVALTLASIFVFHMRDTALIFSNAAAVGAVALLFLSDNASLLSPAAIDPALLKRMLLFSAPLVVSASLVWVNSFSDRYVIDWFHSKGEVGLYGIANRLTNVLSVFSWGILAAYAPFASANALDDASRARYRVSFDLAAMFLALACFIASVFSKEIIGLMTAQAYHGAYVAVPFLMYGMLFYIMANLVGYAFTIKKVGKWYVAVNFACAAANLALNLALVPKYGYVAAAVTTLASYVIAFSLSLAASERVFPCGYDFGRLLIVTLIPGVVAVPLSMSGGVPLKALALAAMALYVSFVYSERVAELQRCGRDWLTRKGFGALNG